MSDRGLKPEEAHEMDRQGRIDDLRAKGCTPAKPESFQGGSEREIIICESCHLSGYAGLPCSRCGHIIGKEVGESQRCLDRNKEGDSSPARMLDSPSSNSRSQQKRIAAQKGEAMTQESFQGGSERIWCMQCGKSVSTPVPKDTILRAWVECPECIEAANKTPGGVLLNGKPVPPAWKDDAFQSRVNAVIDAAQEGESQPASVESFQGMLERVPTSDDLNYNCGVHGLDAACKCPRSGYEEALRIWKLEQSATAAQLLITRLVELRGWLGDRCGDHCSNACRWCEARTRLTELIEGKVQS